MLEVKVDAGKNDANGYNLSETFLVDRIVFFDDLMENFWAKTAKTLRTGIITETVGEFNKSNNL
jgi:hypothetical protein